MVFKSVSTAASIVVAALVGLAAMSVAAQAQFFWGGASGRQTVTFSKKYSPGQVIVSFGDRRLYYIKSRGVALSYPIAVPRPDARWQGVLRVSQKRVNPTWTPTPRMRRKNPKLPVTVPGGHPRNPLGSRALYLGSTLYRIHGTDAPWTIGKNVSSGCVRMHNSHVEELYRMVRTGARVTATWRRYQTGSVGYASAYTGASSASSSQSSSDGMAWRRSILQQ